jgi:predicted ATPase
MQRYIITGAPGAGKTAIVAELRSRGYAVVDEAATDVIAREHARGREEPWRETSFADDIVALQRQRQEEPTPPGTAVQVYDRSPICTVALAHYAACPVSDALAAEVARIARHGIYERRVFFVRPLGFIEKTAARRITYEDSLRFERIHEETYRAHGFDLVDVPLDGVAERADLVERYLRAWRN